MKQTEENDYRWIVMEEGIPHTSELTRKEAEELIARLSKLFPVLEYTLFYDAYYEFTNQI